MKKKGWLRYLSLFMTWALVMSMIPAGAVLAAEEAGTEAAPTEATAAEEKIVLTAFEELKAQDEAAANGLNIYPQGTLIEELGLPGSIKAYDAEANEYELAELEWTIRLKEDEEKLEEILEKIEKDGEESLDEESRTFLKELEEKEKEPEEGTAEEGVKKPNEYDPETTLPGEYVFTLALAEEYALGEEAELPKVVIIIEALEMAEETEAPTEAATEAPVTEAPTEAVTEAPETEAATEAPVTEAPTEAVTEAPETEAATEAPATEVQTEAVTEAPATEAQTEAVTEAPATEVQTEAVTEAPATEAPTEAVTEAPATEAQTEAATEAPATEAQTEAPTEAPATEVQNEAVTEAPATEAQTEAPTEAPETEAVAMEPETEAATEEPVTERETTANESEAILSGEADILEFSVGEKKAVIEGSSIVLTLDCHADLANVIPVIVISDNAKLSVVSAENTLQECTEEMSFDFSDGKEKTFEVLAEDGMTAAVYQVKVTNAAHTPGEWVVATAAGCTTEGQKVQYCTAAECGKLLSTEAIPATGHTPGEWIVTVEAGCETTGQKVQYCTVETCKELVTMEEIPAVGHTLKKEWEVTLEATCTEEGEKVQKCEVCAEIINTEVIEALGHNPRKKWEVTLEATCTEDGERIKTCKRCEEIVETEVIEALGHDWGTGTAPEAEDAKEGWSVTLQPTTSSKGKMERTCQRAGCGVVETREIQRLNIIGQAANNSIWGFSNEAAYPVNSVITFKAIGDGMSNTAPISGDVRYVPSSTWKLVNDYSWSNSEYTASFRVTKEGTYTLTVVFVKQVHDGTQWVNTQETSVKELNFVIEGNGEFTDENGNGTGNTKNPDEVIGAVKTGDNNPIVLLSVVLVLALAVLVILTVVRKRKNTK